MNYGDISRVDGHGMHKVYERWPDIARESYRRSGIDPAGIDHIVFAGMGGSGTIGDVFGAILSRTGIHVSSVKGYMLPETAGPGTLVVAISVSGDTEETLSVLEAATKPGCRVLAASSGGMMEEFCHTNGIDHHLIHMEHSPRASLARYLYSMLGILGPLLPVGDTEVYESITSMEGMRGKISLRNLGGDNPALDLAKWMGGIPIIYHPSGLRSAAVRFKNCLQENAKMHAMTEDIIEACHNGIVPWEEDTRCNPILIRGMDDHPKTTERYDIIRKYLGERGIDCRTVDSVHGGILSKIACLIYMLDYTTIYRAVLSGIDPTPVKSIDVIKSRMRDVG